MGCVKSKNQVAETANKENDHKPVVVNVSGTSRSPRNPNPPIKPPKGKKKDVVPPAETFAAIDEHALKAPKSVCSSVANVAQYLVKPTRSDVEKLRAVYRWIADNIRYDVSGFFSGNSGPQGAEDVLQSGTAVCEGYATLFSALCKEINIPCKKVSGFAKAFGHDPERPFTLNTSTNHAWNIVFINGEWRPIESTWGTGHLNNQNQYEKCFEEVYFLTDPEDFITEHFPYMDKDHDASLPFQLLKQPWSLEKFNTAISPQTKGLEWGFESISHKTHVIEMKNECEITFRTRNVDLQDVLSHLVQRNTNKDYKQYVLLTKKGDKFTAKVTPPAEGKYILELYGKPVGSKGSTYNTLVALVLVCKSCLKNVQPYPDKGGVWGAHIDAKQYGFTDEIYRYAIISTNTGEAELSIKMESRVSLSHDLVHAERDDSNLKRFVFESYNGNTLIIKGRFPYAGFYKLTLFAKDPEKDTSTLDHVADFLIESKTSLDKAKPFPEMYTVAQKYGCVLIQPLTGELPANQDIRLQLQSDKLVRVMINKKVHKSNGNGEFDITFQTPESGETVDVYGSPDEDGSLNGLYVFKVV